MVAPSDFKLFFASSSLEKNNSAVPLVRTRDLITPYFKNSLLTSTSVADLSRFLINTLNCVPSEDFL